MNKKEAEKILKVMALADGGCEYCVRELFIKFIEEFPNHTYLAVEMFEKIFGKELVDEEKAKEIIKKTVLDVLKGHNLELDKIILFGSRAKGNYDRWSDWDILVVVREKLSREEKIELFSEINRRLAGYLIPTDIIIKSSEELDYYKDFYGTVTYEALKEGIVL
jgi:predicted nucleotidyltransferase